MPVFEWVKIENDLCLMKEDSQKYDKYVASLGSGQIVESHFYTPGEMRTLLTNRYLWGGVYPPFINYLSDSTKQATTNDVHEYFCEMLLYQVDVLDINEKSSLEYLNELITKNKIKRFVKQTKIGDDKIQFEWIQSTASLTKREMSKYIEDIKMFGGTVDVYVPESDEFHKNNK